MRKILILLVFLLPNSFASAYTFSLPLEKGMSGEDVYQLQTLLIKKGFLETEATGFFGDDTFQAVTDFQRSVGLEGLGYVGPSTRLILTHFSAPSVNNRSELTIDSLLDINNTQTLSLGSRGEEVVVLQKFLADEGYFTYPEFTGYFGPITAQSLKKYQEEEGLEETPTVDFFIKARIILKKIATTVKRISLSTKNIATDINVVRRLHSGGGGNRSSQISTTTTSTTTPDVNAPTVSLIAPSGTLSAGTATTSIVLNTDEPAECRYKNIPGQPFTSFTTFSTSGNTSHVTSIGGLSNGSNYSVYIRCVDGSDNLSPESTLHFSVATPGGPSVEIQGLNEDETVGGTLSLTASTSDPDSTVVGVTFFIDNVIFGTEDTTNPFSLTFDTNLLSEGPHTVLAVARDDTPIYATSTEISFNVDNTGPVITGFATSSISTSSATISWQTNEPASSFVQYGSTTSYGSISSNTATGTTHSVTLTSLNSSTVYHLKIQAVDTEGNISTSTDFTFTTDAVSGVSLLDTDSRIVWLGNSKDAASFVSSHWQWAAVAYGGRYYAPAYAIQSRGGDDTNDYLARWPATEAIRPQLIIVGDETNNLSNPSQSLSNYDTIIANARAIGSLVAIQKTPASPTISGTSETNRLAINSGLNSRAAEDVIILDTPSVYDGNDTSLSYDGVHENFKGSFNVGQYIGSVVAALINPVTFLPASGQLANNINTVWDMAGTSGTLQTGVTGQVASGWTIDNDTGATAVASKGLLGSHTAQVIQVSGTPTNGSSDLRLFRSINRTLVAGEFYEVVAEVELTGTDGVSAPNGVARYEVSVGQSLMFSRYADSNTQGVVEPFSGVFRASPDVVTTNGSSFTVSIVLRLATGALADAQLKVGRVFVRKIDQVAYAVPYDQSIPGDAGAALFSRPVISGTVSQGNTLSTTPGNFSGGGLTYTYQWKRAGTPIVGANSRTYTLTPADVGSAISVTVTATNTFGSASSTSNSTAPAT